MEEGIAILKKRFDELIDLDVSSWPSGTYLLRITTPTGTTTKKLLIQ